MGLVAIIGTVSGMAVFFWVVSLLGRGAADGASTPASDMLIAIPVLLVLVGGAAAWFLLTRSVANGADEDPYVACGVCSSPILREWRLCPYCGSRVEHPSLDEGSAHPAS